MKTKLAILFSLVMIVAIPCVKAQTPATPPDISKLKNDADFAKYESNVKEYVAWFIKSPIDKDTALRRDISSFLVIWITGAPNVTVRMGNTAAPMAGVKEHKYNGDLLMAYLGGIAVYELNNPKDNNEVNIEMAGLKAVLEMIHNNSALLANNEAAKKYAGMNANALSKYVQDCVAKDQQSK